jgi:hypothetical protein
MTAAADELGMNHEQLDAIDHIRGLLGRLEIPYWLFGGWAVDFYAGGVTREHSDIDIAIWCSDLDRTTRALDQDGWRVALVSAEQGLLQLQKHAVCLDLTYLERDEATGSVYTPLPAGRGAWADDAFGEDLAELRGIRVRVVSLDSLVGDKSEDRSDPGTRAKDRADLAVLKEL